MGNMKIESINWEEVFPQVPDCVHEAIEEANQIVLQKKARKIKRISRKGILILAASLTLMSGMTVMAATNLWQQRMEELNAQAVEEYFLSITTSNAPAFRYNRAMTEVEKKQFEELNVQYEEAGVFPAGVLTMLSNVEEYRGKNVGYEPESGTFFLPEKELTREQLLQIIDFYHKVDYSLQKVNEQVEAGIMELPTEETVQTDNEETDEAGEGISMMQELESLNDKVSYWEMKLSGEALPGGVAVGKDYVYLGYANEIRRMPIGTSEYETIYELGEQEALFAIEADRENAIFLSTRKYIASEDAYINKLVKLDAEGNVITEYDVESAVFGEDERLGDMISYRMREDADGRLYVKSMWASRLLLFVFDEDGNYLDAIYDERYRTHVANWITFGEDGYLYVLGEEEIMKVDTEAMAVVEAFHYATEDMVAAVGILQPIDEDTFYLFSYDGLFRTTLGEETSQRILAPYESAVFAEGCKSAPISDDTIIAVNYLEEGIKITYLLIEE